VEPVKESGGISVTALALEFISIVVGVLVALGANQWKESRSRHELALSALAGIRREITINQAYVNGRLFYHQMLVDSLSSEINRLTTARQRTPAGDARAAHMRSPAEMGMTCGLATSPAPAATAWQVVLNTNVLTYLDYRTVATLTETYAIQQQLVHQMDESYTALLPIFDAVNGEREPLAPLEVLGSALVDLRSIEVSTSHHYARTQALLDTLGIPPATVKIAPSDSTAPCRSR
jgi:hypothetical protein